MNGSASPLHFLYFTSCSDSNCLIVNGMLYVKEMASFQPTSFQRKGILPSLVLYLFFLLLIYADPKHQLIILFLAQKYFSKNNSVASLVLPENDPSEMIFPISLLCKRVWDPLLKITLQNCINFSDCQTITPRLSSLLRCFFAMFPKRQQLTFRQLLILLLNDMRCHRLHIDYSLRSQTHREFSSTDRIFIIFHKYSQHCKLGLIGIGLQTGLCPQGNFFLKRVSLLSHLHASPPYTIVLLSKLHQ